INFAEAQQLIVPLTRHLFKLIAKEAPLLMDILPQGAKLGVNIAPGHLHSPEFKEDIRQFAASLPDGRFQVVFEITERDMIKEKEAVSLFAWLHQQGFEIAVDDFGTGHSALIYLERFTMDYLKIDRGFVNAIGTETVTSPVLDAVITLARRLNMTTVAEGVETWEQTKWLRDRGVNYLQGFFFSRPVRVAQLIDWQRQRSGK
ncbi:EAL domain-containing protein, partial [Atlantibacter subterraneus]|uniref:EAL domain-containing protein n=1 Tax=Atlantibacter subterraneus TaxID=255519 RepID=UPI002FDCBF3E